jgi:hypothetical protein
MDGQLPLPMWYLDVGIINPWGFYRVDGIVGLGQSILSLPSHFQEIYANIVSYCLVSFDSSTMNVSAFFLWKSRRIDHK